MRQRLLLLFLLCPTLTYAANTVVQIDGGDKAVPITDVTVSSSATLVSAANASRINLNCTNNDSAVNVRWGDSTVTTGSGQRINAGASVEIKNIGPVYMISEGADVTVSCTEERN